MSSYVRYLAEGLKSDNNEIEILCVHPDGVTSPLATLRFLVRAAVRISKFKPYVLHAHGVWQAATPLILRLHGRTIFTFHTEPNLGRFRTRLAIRLLLRSAHVSTTVTVYLKSRIEAAIGKSSVKVIPPNIPIVESTSTREKARVLLGLPSTAFVLAAITSLAYPEKAQGLNILLDTLLDDRESHLVIAGNGRYMTQLENAVHIRNLEGRTHILGDLSDPSIVFDAADVYVHASLKDNLPISMLEAMGKGIPVVAFRVGGIPEAIRHGETGLLCEAEVDSLGRALTQLRGDKQLRRILGDHARNEIIQRYSWERIRALWRTVYTM